MQTIRKGRGRWVLRIARIGKQLRLETNNGKR
jgi:hypothetical protein